MEKHIKKASTLVPKMFRTFAIYIILTLSVFFGYIQIFGKIDQGDSGTDVTPTEASFMSKMTEKLIGMEDISTDLKFSVENDSLKLELSGDIMFDRKNMSAFVNLDLNYNPKTSTQTQISSQAVEEKTSEIFKIMVTYTDPNLYIKLDDQYFKFDVKNGVDFKDLIDLIKNNVKFDGQTSLEDVLNKIGLGELDIEAIVADIMTQLEQDPIPDDKGNYSFILQVGGKKKSDAEGTQKKLVTLKLICDSNYYLNSIVLANDTLIKGNKISFRAPHIKIDKGVSIDFDETQNTYVDMTGLSKYASYAQNLSKSQYINADVNVKVGEEVVDANLVVNTTNGLGAQLKTQYEGVDVEIAYKNDEIYLNVAGLKVKMKAQDLQKWSDTICAIIEKQTNMPVADFVKKLINDNFDISNKQNSAVEIIKQILAGGEKSQEKLVKYFPNETELTENSFVMKWENGAVVTLNSENEMLSKIEVVSKETNVLATFTTTENEIVLADDYFDLTSFLPVSKVVDDILTTKSFEGTINLDIDGTALNFDVKVDFKDDVLIELTTNYMGEKLSLFAQNSVLKIQIGEVVLEGDLLKYEEYISKIDAIFGTDISNKIASSKSSKIQKTDVVEVLRKISEILNQVKVEEKENDLAVIKYLDSVVEIALGENDTLLVGVIDKTISADVKIYAKDVLITLPQTTDTIDSTLEKVESVKNYVETKKYAGAFDVVYKNIRLSGNAKINLVDNIFEVEIDKIANNALKVIYKNDTAFIDYAGRKISIAVKDVKSLINIISPIINANVGMTNTENSNGLSDILSKIFGEDVSTWSVDQILAKLSVNIDGSLSDMAIGAVILSKNEVDANVKVKFDQNDLSALEISACGAIIKANVCDFDEIVLNENDYYDLLSAQSGTVTLAYQTADGKLEVSADVELKLKDKIYLKVGTEVLGTKIQILIDGADCYITLGQINLHTSFDGAKELVDKIVELFKLTLPSTSETKNIEEMLETIDLNSIDLLKLEGLEWNVSNGVQISYNKDGLIVDANFSNSKTSFEKPTAPTNCEELGVVLEKIASVKNLIDSGVVETTYLAQYNGWNFEGTVKYFADETTKVVELCVDNVCGEKVVIRIENSMMYLGYGNVKYKYQIPKNESTGKVEVSLSDIQNVMKKLTSNELPVEIDFGVFTEIINILRDYNFEVYLKNIKLNIDNQTGDIVVEISNKTDLATTKIITSNIHFEENNVASVDVDVFKILSAQITLCNTKESTIKAFNEEDYKDYSSDFIGELMTNLAVEKNSSGEDYVYAFSSDIAIRYSTNSFKGELVAMLVKDDSNNTMFGKYMPAISVHTTSLGLNSYIYYINDTAYIDINGLQIKAVVNDQTIDEITKFVQDNFGIGGSAETESVQETAEVFRVLLPAIDQIYGAWLEGGIQINIDDDLNYTANSRFYDIVTKVMVEGKGSALVPTSIVLGANIDDPNTTLLADYSSAWLEDEENITKSLNFAVYLKNMVVGKALQNLDEIFVGKTVGEEINYNNVVAVKSNYTTSALSEFNDYKTVLDAVKSVYDYYKTMNFKFNLDASISSDTTTRISGNVIANLADDDKENPKAQYKLGDKILNVEGDLDINAKNVLHKISLFYSNYQEGLYLTYSHGSLIGNKAFKGKISNSHMSEIVAMIARFAGMNLSETTKENLNLTDCKTDFRYLKELMGMKDADKDEETSKVDEVLSSVTNMTKMLKNIKLERVELGSGLYQTKLSIKLDIEGDGNIAIVEICLNEEKQNDETKLVLRKIALTNLVYSGKTINATINIEDYDANAYKYDTSASHIDLSDISSFLDVAVNTLNTKGFNFKGKTTVNIPVIGTVGVGFDILAKFNDQNKLELYMELDVEEKREVTWTAVAGQDTYTTYNVVASKKAWDKRITKISYANEVLKIENKTYGSRRTDFSSAEDIVKNYSYTKDQIGDNIMLIVTQSLGLTNTVHDVIKYAISKIDAHPTVEEAFLDFGYDGSKYMLKINAENLTGMSGVKDMTLNIGVSKDYRVNVYEEKKVFNRETKEYEIKKGWTERTYRFIDSISTEMNIKDIIIIPLELGSASGASYETTGGVAIYTNDYYRKLYLGGATNHTVKFVAFTTKCPYTSLILSSGETVVFPVLTTKEETVDNLTTYYEFGGWYYENTFKTPVEGEVIVQDDDLKFYAKWIAVRTERTNSINIYHNGEFVETLHIKTGDELKLEYDFINENCGYYYDKALTQELPDLIVRDGDIDVYVVQKYVVNVYHNGARAVLMKFKEDDEVDLSGLDFVSKNSLFYSDENFTNETASKFVMDTNEHNIYVTEKYTVTMTSEYGIKSASFYGFVGDAIELPKQEDYVEYAETTKTTYTFVGYSEDLTSIPNCDVTIVANWKVVVEDYYKVEIYNYKTLVDTLHFESGEVVDLSKYSFVNSESQICADENFTDALTNYTVTDSAMKIYVRNKFTVKVVSEYGENTTFTDWQGTKINLPTQHKDTFDDKTTKRIVYTFTGYTFSDGATEMTEIGDHDVTATANWSVDSKNYYTVNFDVRKYKPSSWVAGGHWKSGSEPAKPSSICVLEGTYIDLTQSQYKPFLYGYETAAEKLLFGTDVTITYYATSWGLSAWSNGTKAKSGFTSYTVNGQNATNGIITLYACWDG